MRHKVKHSLIGFSLVASLVAVPTATPIGAQGGWQGFSANSVPSGLENGAANDSPAWSASVTNDIGGPGVDLWVNNHAEKSEALVDWNGGATMFADSLPSPLTLSDTHGATFTDIDGDGDEDMIEVMGRDHDNRVYRNNNGNLNLVAGTTGIEDFAGRGRHAVMVDIDNDGDMDALVANLDRTALGGDPEPSEIYLNNGNGTTWTKVADASDVLTDINIRFAQVTSAGPGTPNVIITSNGFAVALDSIAIGSLPLSAAASPFNQTVGMDDNASFLRDVALGDLDGDLAPEFVVARQDDFHGAMYDLTNPENPVEATPPDFNHQGDLPIGIGQLSTSALVSDDIVNVSADPLVDGCRAVALADYDNDQDLDIFGGCTFFEENQTTNVVLLNDGNGNFSLGAAALVPATGNDTASVAINADFNDDGWIDTYVGAGYDFQPGPDHIFLNQGGNGNHWLKLDLVATNNPDAVGAQVFVGTDKWQVRETGHRMHQGQDMRELHFGLGTNDEIAPIEIRWPDGTHETCTVDGVDRTVTITQGSADCQAQSASGQAAVLAAAPVIDQGPPPPAPKFCEIYEVTVDLSAGELPTNGDDVILGTPGVEVINGLGGDDIICGLGGADTINGGPGSDRIYGGAGHDVINGGDERDFIFAGKGNDTVNGDGGGDFIRGGFGRDIIRGGDGKDRIWGKQDDDRIFGDAGGDTLRGNRGNDTIDGGTEWDLCGGGVRVNCEGAA